MDVIATGELFARGDAEASGDLFVTASRRKTLVFAAMLQANETQAYVTTIRPT